MDDPLLHNRPFDELAVGDTASLVRTASQADIDQFAALSGDVNPAHLDAKFAATDSFGHVVLHGMWTASLISSLLGTALPGPGTIYLDQSLQFRHPVQPGDVITASVTVREKRPEKHVVLLDTLCVNAQGQTVLSGVATVSAPTVSIVCPRMPLPQVFVQRHSLFDGYIQRARAGRPLRTAVVHPCSADAIKAAVEARDEGLLDPVLIGPRAKIEAAAEEAGVSLAGMRLDDVEHSHAAAARAVELAGAGEVSALMKGSLHTDELLSAVLARDSRLRIGRRVSHVYAMDIPAYAKPLIITDAAINIAPTLSEKADICQNAVDMLHVLGIERPRVAVLAAVEMVNPFMQATLDAAALTVMSARGQIRGAIVDGPLAFDNAISAAAARTKGIESPVAGQADILLVPDLESGNMLAKQLIYFAGADAAGLVLGAKLPIILTSRSDSLRVRLASIALATLAATTAQSGKPDV